MVYQLESPDINTVINYCKDLCANDKIEVYDFGGKKDLVLHIYKDEDFDQNRYCNGSVQRLLKEISMNNITVLLVKPKSSHLIGH